MRKILGCLLGMFFHFLGFGQQPAIIPMPASLQMGNGSFTLTKNTLLVVSDAEDAKAARFLNDYLKSYYHLELKTSAKPVSANAIRLTTRRFIKAPDKDAYLLQVNASGILIEGDTYAGTFYGIQTLIQLLPVPGTTPNHPASKKSLAPSGLIIPALTIQDEPRFAYRGMHLDVCRHFFPPSFIKKYIDYLALHKMNFFHWHLTDDQGWRIQIKKYPRLTEVGGCRNGTIIGRYPGTGNDSIRYCGFYRQEEIRQLVQYAADRHITIIPELEMPGHSSAALTAYPWLGCPGTGPYRVEQTWGVFDDVYCAGKDSTFQFLQDVLDEVMELFPSPYLHIGGDECPKTNWKACPLCQKRIRDEHLKDENELQSYFTRRIEKYVNARGRIIIGWDEILEGGLAPNALVMSWRGDKGGQEAASQNHRVIMTPQEFVYFDHAQKLAEDSITFGGFVPLEKVYSFEPIPKNLPAGKEKYILGGQGNVWTEYIANTAKLEYMVFPRLSALSEALWSPKEKRSLADFTRRLPVQMARYQLWGVNFSTAYYDISAALSPATGNNGVQVQLQTNDSVGITYRTSLSEPEKPYSGPIQASRDLQLLARKAGRFADSLQLNLHVSKATGKKLSLSPQPLWGFEGNGAFTLEDGIINEMGLSRSREVLGFKGGDVTAVFDLDSAQSISSVTVHTLLSGGSRVYPVQRIEVYGSSEGKSFTRLGAGQNLQVLSPLKGKLSANFSEAKARYVKVVIQPLAQIPAGRAGAGEKPLFFVDEIEIR